MSCTFAVAPSLMSFVIRTSIFEYGSASSALRGITSPELMTAGPSQRSSAAAGMTIADVGPPAAVRLRRFEPVFPYGAVAIVALERLPDPYPYDSAAENPIGSW